MEDIWLKACEYYKLPKDISKSWYVRIQQRLSSVEPVRAYHNWNEMMLLKLKDMQHLKPCIVLAVFFQYYCFDSQRDCAQENCLAFSEFCDDALFEDESSKILILKLLGDTTIEYNDIYDTEKSTLQDIDLAILGASSDIYKHYTQLLRCEYSNVTNESYKSMRIKVLETLLMIPNIFSTEEFQAKYELQARINIKTEITELKIVS